MSIFSGHSQLSLVNMINLSVLISFTWSKASDLITVPLWLMSLLRWCISAAGAGRGLVGLPVILAVSPGSERHRARGAVRPRIPAAGVRTHQQDGPQVRHRHPKITQNITNKSQT